MWKGCYKTHRQFRSRIHTLTGNGDLNLRRDFGEKSNLHHRLSHSFVILSSIIWGCSEETCDGFGLKRRTLTLSFVKLSSDTAKHRCGSCSHRIKCTGIKVACTPSNTS